MMKIVIIFLMLMELFDTFSGWANLRLYEMKRIAQIKMWLIDLDRKTREIEFLQSGDSVQIESGLLMDQFGEVLKRQGNNLLMKLESLGIMLWVESSKNKLVQSITQVA